MAIKRRNNSRKLIIIIIINYPQRSPSMKDTLACSVNEIGREWGLGRVNGMKKTVDRSGISHTTGRIEVQQRK